MNKFKVISVILGLLFLTSMLASCTAAVVGAGAGAGAAGYSVGRDERTLSKQIDDNVIGAEIRGLFNDNEKIKSLSVSIYSYDGSVYLVGLLDNDGQGIKMRKLASSVKGVRMVSTYFLFKGDAGITRTISDSTITAMVKAALIADKKIKSTQITVETVKGHVVLLGIVQSSYELKRAEQIAGSVKGVESVENFIRLKAYM